MIYTLVLPSPIALLIDLFLTISFIFIIYRIWDKNIDKIYSSVINLVLYLFKITNRLHNRYYTAAAVLYNDIQYRIFYNRYQTIPHIKLNECDKLNRQFNFIIEGKLTLCSICTFITNELKYGSLNYIIKDANNYTFEVVYKTIDLEYYLEFKYDLELDKLDSNYIYFKLFNFFKKYL